MQYENVNWIFDFKVKTTAKFGNKVKFNYLTNSSKLVNPLKIYAFVSATLFLLMIVVSMNTQIQYDSMLLGMGLGISTSPLMMHVIKRWKTKRKVNKMIRELHVIMNKQNEQEKTENKIDSNNSEQKINLKS